MTSKVEAATVTAGYTEPITEHKAFFTLAAFGARVWAGLLWLIQIFTSQWACCGALIKVAVFWAWQGWRGEREDNINHCKSETLLI